MDVSTDPVASVAAVSTIEVSVITVSLLSELLLFEPHAASNTDAKAKVIKVLFIILNLSMNILG